ncbi:hypothetical protein [Gilliamella apicola]
MTDTVSWPLKPVGICLFLTGGCTLYINHVPHNLPLFRSGAGYCSGKD